MKYYFSAFLTIVCSFILAGSTFPGGLNWITDYDQAQERAKNEGKLVLVYFSGSDWCRPCMQLKEEVFNSGAFEAFANEHVVLLQVDFPAKKKNQLPQNQTDHNEKMAEKYNKSGAFPHVVILDTLGGVVAEVSGYQGEDVEAYLFKLKSQMNESLKGR